ncbi:MAG TPA: Na+/H+ antiporter NhaA, partial [Caulobacteraceae bacterium]|nr:Na+/H+ antiporter NhaA [Caulobacteraceae bacterium]
MARRLTLDYLKTESGSGLVPVGAAALAIVLANSPASADYFAFIGAPFTIQVGAFDETQSVFAWVKDALMAILFLVVGMQVKFEVIRGELSSYRRLGLPVLAALGGAVAPALVYLAFNVGPGGQPQAWPTAVVTDTAFALAILSMAAPRMPSALRVFLMTLAMADNLAAVGLIAVLFAGKLHAAALAGAGVTLALLAVMGWWKRAPFAFYAAGFVLVWAFVLESGLNTSIAGVACAMTVPIGARRTGQESALKFFMDSLHPYVAYGVLPLFAFCAAGFSLAGLSAPDLLGPAPLGIAIGLAVGKPLGILAFCALAVALRIGRRPTGVTWLELAGAASLA